MLHHPRHLQEDPRHGPTPSSTKSTASKSRSELPLPPEHLYPFILAEPDLARWTIRRDVPFVLRWSGRPDRFTSGDERDSTGCVPGTRRWGFAARQDARGGRSETFTSSGRSLPQGRRETQGELADTGLGRAYTSQKHFSTLLREGDTLARKVLDDELALLTSSLTAGEPIKFDYLAALSGTGNGWYGGGSGGGRGPAVNIASEFGVRTADNEGWDEVEIRERDFGTV